MPSTSNSRASAPKNHSKTAPPKVNGGGQVLPGAKSNSAAAKPPPAQPKTASTSDPNRKDPVGNAPSQNIDTPTGGLRTETGTNSTDGTDNAGPTVNRKKQKRRLKQAARLAAEKPATVGSSSNQAYVDSNAAAYNGTGYALPATQTHSAQVSANGYDYEYDDAEYEPEEGEDQFYSDENARLREKPHPGIRVNGSSNGQPSENHSAKAKKKKKSKAGSEAQPAYQASYDRHDHSYSNGNTAYQQPPPPPPPTLSTAALRSARNIPKDRIWNTSTAEERERIKEFWLTLGEAERRSLVKVEKDAVLRKMKEQQKHSCSCTVCGRKRTAIEEELEVLYDAYYEELEQYANNQQGLPDEHTHVPPASRAFGHRNPPNRATQDHNHARSSGSRIQEIADDEDEGDDESYDEEDGDEDDGSEEISDGEPEAPEAPMGPAADFFNFGNSLTVQGGILTVADDLLKNDGKKFIEMMEQLAERRMQREEEAQFQNAGLRHPGMQPHNHGPPLDEDAEYDEEDEEDYDSQDEDYEDDEMEPPMTEQQRMEEGRRMFQIFAARMFEQRVLTAYREKVSLERQEKLIEELDEESRLDTQREAKKAREAQKKKDKKRQQKQAKDEEKAKREAEKAAEEAALKAVEEKKLEEQRQKKEEQRKKREAERKAQEEEKQRKEAEKQKRLQEAREQQAELERKQREAKDREKKKREEAKKKEREEREAKEREVREKKEREAAEKKELEDRSRLEKDRKKADEHAPKQATPAPVVPNLPSSTKPNAAVTTASHISSLVPQQAASSHASPHLPIATPLLPKAPTPIRARQASFQDSHSTSPKTSLPPAESSTTSPSAPSQASNISIPSSVKTGPQPQNFPQDQQTSSLPPGSGAPGPPTQPPGFSGPPAMTMNTFPATFSSILPNVSRGPVQDSPIFQHQTPFNGTSYRPFGPPPGINSLNMMRPIPQNRSSAMEPPSPQIPIGPSNAGHIGQFRPHNTMPTHSHSRQSSTTFDRSAFENYTIPAQTQPIARPNPVQPTPIQRPSSVAPYQQSDTGRRHTHEDTEGQSNHLGSSALLEGTDVPYASNATNSRRGSLALGGSRPARQGFNAPVAFQDPIGTAKTDSFGRPAPLSDSISSTWNSTQASMNGPHMSGPATWSNASRPGWPANYPFSPLGGPPRSSGSRALTIRQLVVQACTKLTARPSPNSRGGYHNVQDVLREVMAAKPPSEGPISMEEMLEICDTEGNTQNGGGTLKIEVHGQSAMYIKFEPGRSMSMGMGPGDIGSPAIGYSRLG